MPQAKTAEPQQTQDNGTPDVPDMLEASGPFVAALIHQAKMLEGERDEHAQKIGKNREQLRGLDELGALTVEQGDWLEAFYATKAKGDHRTPEEIKLTREVKDAARKYYKEQKKR